MPGPPPKPENQLRLAGSPRAGQRAARGKPSGPPPKPPNWLSKEARAIWDVLVPAQHARGLADEPMAFPLARYCDMYVMQRRLSRKLAREGVSYRCETEAGQTMHRAHPEARFNLELARELRALERELLITPEIRARLDAGEDPGVDDDDDEPEGLAAFMHEPG